jgi:mRNA interferase MazF
MSIIINFKKNFADWFALKPKLDIQNHKPLLVNEGEIWWCRLGENIRVEISGKGDIFARPVIIHTKLSKYCYLVIPCSTSDKQGSWFVKFVHNKIPQIAILSQARIVDYRRLKNKLGDIDQTDFDNVCIAFEKLYSKKDKK